jgi:hypothetical protein
MDVRKHLGRVVNSLASYSGGPGFKSQPGDSYPDCSFPQSLQANDWIVL